MILFFPDGKKNHSLIWEGLPVDLCVEALTAADDMDRKYAAGRGRDKQTAAKLPRMNPFIWHSVLPQVDSESIQYSPYCTETSAVV